jgi:hypothetical protein
MKYRIAVWAGVGFLVAVFWALYFTLAAPATVSSVEPVWTFARFTCPIALASIHFHFPVSVYWAILANAATYALLALMVETLRQQLGHAK